MIDFPTPEERRKEAQRLLEGLTAAWVAERIGMSKATVSKWKRGERIPDLEHLLRLPDATNRPLAASLQERLLGHSAGPEPVGKEPDEKVSA